MTATLTALPACAPGAVPVAVPRPSGGPAQACRALHAALPPVVDSQDQRDTRPASRGTAAWGDPAIVLRCGVPRPRGLTRTSQLAVVNGVEWYTKRHAGGYRFTSTGRVARVQVTVPGVYAPEVNPLVDLAAPVSRAVPRDGRRGP
ncbi:MAG: DUF3515 domain-containing protein [Carbonactinosporaceae bacterium]